MFLSAYKKEAMNKSSKEKSTTENFSPIKTIKKNQNSKKSLINYSDRANESSRKEKKANNASSNFSLEKFENKTKKGIKFGLLEYKRVNEIRNFDICNCI